MQNNKRLSINFLFVIHIYIFHNTINTYKVIIKNMVLKYRFLKETNLLINNTTETSNLRLWIKS